MLLWIISFFGTVSRGRCCNLNGCHRLQQDCVLENNKMCEENGESQVVKVDNEFYRTELDGKRQLNRKEIVMKRKVK
jgi:hypothetical protein